MGSHPIACWPLLGADDELTAEVGGFAVVKSGNEERFEGVRDGDNSLRILDKVPLTGFSCLYNFKYLTKMQVRIE